MTPFPDPIYVTSPLLPPLEAVMARLADVWASRWITNNGRQHELLESALRAHLGVPHLSLFNNGTIALFAAVRALGLGGEVVTTPFTFPATPHALAWSGITPVFADIDPVRLTLDPAQVEAAITPKTTGILGVHVYGIPCDVERLQEVADRHGLRVLYDGAHAFGTTVNGAGIGTFGDITMFSFHATKLFHTAEGGALACREPATADRVNQLKNFGILGPETVASIGLNGKMNEMQAALGLAVLDCLQDEIAKRKTLLGIYRRLLADVPGVSVVTEPPGIGSSYQYCAIRVDESRFGRSRDDVHGELQKHNVISRKYFFPLCSDYPCYRDLPSAAPGCLPVARKVAREVLCLPLYGSLPASAVQDICAIVAAIPGGAA